VCKETAPVPILFLRVSWSETFVLDWLQRERENNYWRLENHFIALLIVGGANWNWFDASWTWLHRVDYSLLFCSVNWNRESAQFRFSWYPTHYPDNAVCRPIPEPVRSPKPWNCWWSCSPSTRWYTEQLSEYVSLTRLMPESERPTYENIDIDVLLDILNCKCPEMTRLYWSLLLDDFALLSLSGSWSVEQHKLEQTDIATAIPQSNREPYNNKHIIGATTKTLNLRH
jgi:hypothetical protein